MIHSGFKNESAAVSAEVRRRKRNLRSMVGLIFNNENVTYRLHFVYFC